MGRVPWAFLHDVTAFTLVKDPTIGRAHAMGHVSPIGGDHEDLLCDGTALRWYRGKEMGAWTLPPGWESFGN